MLSLLLRKMKTIPASVFKRIQIHSKKVTRYITKNVNAFSSNFDEE